jgi:microsomal dipeptidase-like Zn-dependent dipeptidase
MATNIVVNGKSNVYDVFASCERAAVMSEDVWADKAKRLLRAEMVKRGVSYEQLAERLHQMGIEETPVNIRNKVARGKFMASFLLQCLEAIGVQIVRLEEV